MSWVEQTSVGAWDLGKEMLENGENHDNAAIKAQLSADWGILQCSHRGVQVLSVDAVQLFV